MKLTLSGAALLLIIACNPTPQKTADKKSAPAVEMLTTEQTVFIRQWSETYNPKNIPVLAIFRNRYFHKTDLNQLHEYLKRNKKDVDFSMVEKELRIKTELYTDTDAVNTITWINNTDVETCDKVDRDFWGCFNRRYTTNEFYYLSMPLFSSDNQWCMLHVALQRKEKGQSFGGGRLYHLVKGKWKEVAFLSNWGKQPE
ncbi:MAG: hypothetical protein V4651_04940 [Bacteroidota bacterium]